MNLFLFVEGLWSIQLKTGDEFLRNFELNRHVTPVTFNRDLTVHVSMDSNVYPYIAIGVFQFIRNGEGWIIRMINELPAIDPENTASQAGQKIAKFLRSIGYNQRVFLYGDRSTKSRNNIDDDKRSFFQIVDENIKKNGFITQDCMDSCAPPVASIGDFVNAIFNDEVPGLSIEIGENCKTAISDFIETKTDKDGTILKKRVTDPKTKVSYEPNGHYVDLFKDMIYQAFTKEYSKYLSGIWRVEANYKKGIE